MDFALSTERAVTVKGPGAKLAEHAQGLIGGKRGVEAAALMHRPAAPASICDAQGPQFLDLVDGHLAVLQFIAKTKEPIGGLSEWARLNSRA